MANKFQISVGMKLRPSNLPELLSGGQTEKVDRAFRVFMANAEATAKSNLSGPVLNVQSGRLRSSVTHAVVVSGPGEWEGRLGTDVVYGAIHEFGGEIPPHMIYPKDPGGVLAFEMGGQTVFAKFVNHPGSIIPPRPYLQPALDQHWPQFVEDVTGIYNRIVP